MKNLRELDVNEMARVAGGYGGDGYCGTLAPGQWFPRPHGGDPWMTRVAAVSQYQVNPAVGAIAVGKIAGF